MGAGAESEEGRATDPPSRFARSDTSVEAGLPAWGSESLTFPIRLVPVAAEFIG
jgi:hypothetical protein